MHGNSVTNININYRKIYLLLSTINTGCVRRCYTITSAQNTLKYCTVIMRDILCKILHTLWYFTLPNNTAHIMVLYTT